MRRARHGQGGLEAGIVTWLQRYRLKDFLRSAVWLPSVLSMPVAILAGHVLDAADGYLGWMPPVGVEGARTVLTALASAMLTFIVFVFSMLLVTVQLASAQLTPRVIAHFYRGAAIRWSLCLFVFVFTFDLVVLVRMETAVPALSAYLATFGTVAAIGVFLFMIERVAKSLRPVSVLTSIGRVGHGVLAEVYPHRFVAAAGAPSDGPATAVAANAREIASPIGGVVLALDVAGLAALARRADCTIEVVPQVGDFVASGDALFRVHGRGDWVDPDLHQHVAIGPERTLEQDPAFAFRIIVDVAAKALSPAINDPTTAVLAIDQLHHLLRLSGLRDLDTGRVRDEAGRLRLVYRTPDWEDFVALAVTEVRQYGRDSIQVARRLRAMLESLVAVVPAERVARLREELDLLNRTVERAFVDPEDRTRAGRGDSLGMGGA